MSQLYSDDYLDRQLSNAEIDISSRCPIIFNRFSIAVTKGQAVYTLPDGIVGILRITYMSKEVLPLEMSDIDYSNWIKPANLSPQGIPKFYLRMGWGYKAIKFQPQPDLDVAANDAIINTVTGMQSTVIINCYQISQPKSSNDVLRTPAYLRRNLMKYYVMREAFSRQGKGQNIAASVNFGRRYDMFLQRYYKIIEKIPQCVQLVMGPEVNRYLHRPPKPVLPTTGKWSL